LNDELHDTEAGDSDEPSAAGAETEAICDAIKDEVWPEPLKYYQDFEDIAPPADDAAP